MAEYSRLEFAKERRLFEGRDWCDAVNVIVENCFNHFQEFMTDPNHQLYPVEIKDMRNKLSRWRFLSRKELSSKYYKRLRKITYFWSIYYWTHFAKKRIKNDMMEKESPLVSVIIPVYNAHNSIAKTLQSVINQTYTNLEIVVVNDGSTDESLDIIKTYAVEDPRIVVFDKQNEGLVQARKSGIDIATGKYIQYLDSDDIMHEDAITRLVNKAEETQADMVVAPFMFCYDGESHKSTFLIL